MTDTSLKMLQMVLNGQNSMKADMIREFKKVRDEISNLEERLSKKIDAVDIKLTKRIDNLGRQLAYLDDDVPTREEFDELTARVNKLQSKVALGL